MDKPDLDHLVGETLALEAEDAKKAGTIGYMARMLVQATMPHKQAKGNEFTCPNCGTKLLISKF